MDSLKCIFPEQLKMSVSIFNCPNCNKRIVRWRYTLKGILYAVLLFPCGIYCCIRKRQQYCPQCKCDVVLYQETVKKFGHSNHNHSGIPPALSITYRNAALSTINTVGSHDTSNRCMSNTSKN